MREINLLDCTLRDGGYINNWHFGYGTICDILQKLSMSNVEYVECGYLSELKGGDKDDTQYKNLDAFRAVLPEKTDKQRFALMIDFGKYPIEHIPEASADAPTIRVCFHKKDAARALEYCGQLMQKGYSVFVQPMASLNYSDVEFVELIQRVNEMHPACFYIVDSFGVMEIEDFQRILSIAENNLDQTIMLGYHAHNNLQQAYGNAKYMLEQNLTHNIILDSSVYGMGRGAGNLNTELFAAYLNKRYDKSYNIDVFMDIMDEHLKPIFSEHFWGYSLPFYLSAQYNCHPNYAKYYADKNTLSNKSMKQLLASLPDDVKIRYSEELAEEYYQLHQKNFIDDREACDNLRKQIEGKEILIVAPGKSIVREREKIDRFIDEKKPVIFGVNVAPEGFACEFLICTNEKRIKRLELSENTKLIITSNLQEYQKPNQTYVINYASYLSPKGMIADNPTLMLLQLFTALGKQKVYIAGFDGYSTNPKDNYFDEQLSLGTSLSLKLQKNGLIRDRVKEISKQIEVEFITESMYSS